MISFPKRIRHYLQTEAILQTVLRMVIDEIRKRIIACSPNIIGAQFGAISFIQRFGTTPNLHPHFHLVVADGIFEMKDGLFQFHEVFLTLDDIADIQDNIQKCILKLFARRGWIEKNEVEKMLEYENSGFSLDAKVKIESWDREDLERLIKYCAQTLFCQRKFTLKWSVVNLSLTKAHAYRQNFHPTRSSRIYRQNSCVYPTAPSTQTSLSWGLCSKRASAAERDTLTQVPHTFFVYRYLIFVGQAT